MCNECARVMARGVLPIENLTLGAPGELSSFHSNSQYYASKLLEIPLSVLKSAQINLEALMDKFKDRITISGEMASLQGPVRVYLPAGNGAILAGRAVIAVVATAIVAFALLIIATAAPKLGKKINKPPLIIAISVASGVAMALAMTKTMHVGNVYFL